MIINFLASFETFIDERKCLVIRESRILNKTSKHTHSKLLLSSARRMYYVYRVKG